MSTVLGAHVLERGGTHGSSTSPLLRSLVSAILGANVLPTYPRADVTFVSRRGRLARRRLGQALSRLPGRDRRLRARPLPPGGDGRDPRPARPPLAHVQPLLDAADGRARHPPLGSVRRRAGVLRQLGRGGDRGRPQVRAQGHRQDGHRRARRLVPRPYLRGPVDDGSAGEASRVRAARARRPLRPPERRGVAGGRRRRRQRRLRPPRAHPGRGRNPPGYARLPRDSGRARGGTRRPALLRRDPVRPGSHRHVLRPRAARDQASARRAGKGARQWAADRRASS